MNDSLSQSHHCWR